MWGLTVKTAATADFETWWCLELRLLPKVEGPVVLVAVPIPSFSIFSKLPSHERAHGRQVDVPGTLHQQKTCGDHQICVKVFHDSEGDPSLDKSALNAQLELCRLVYLVWKGKNLHHASFGEYSLAW